MALLLPLSKSLLDSAAAVGFVGCLEMRDKSWNGQFGTNNTNDRLPEDSSTSSPLAGITVSRLARPLTTIRINSIEHDHIIGIIETLNDITLHCRSFSVDVQRPLEEIVQLRCLILFVPAVVLRRGGGRGSNGGGATVVVSVTTSTL